MFHGLPMSFDDTPKRSQEHFVYRKNNLCFISGLLERLGLHYSREHV